METFFAGRENVSAKKDHTGTKLNIIDKKSRGKLYKTVKKLIEAKKWKRND